MDVILRVSNDTNKPYESNAIPASNLIMGFSPNAFDKLAKKLGEIENICVRCHTVCLSEELVAGECSGVGCDADLDWSSQKDSVPYPMYLIHMAAQGFETLRIGVTQVYKNIEASVSEDDHDDPPEPIEA